ncbi:hypothetical protein YC2023_055430 [Brassica napus]
MSPPTTHPPQTRRSPPSTCSPATRLYLLAPPSNTTTPPVHNPAPPCGIPQTYLSDPAGVWLTSALRASQHEPGPWKISKMSAQVLALHLWVRSKSLGLVTEQFIQLKHHFAILRNGLYGTRRCKREYFRVSCRCRLEFNVTIKSD